MNLIIFKADYIPVESSHQSQGQHYQQQDVQVDAHQCGEANECEDEQDKGEVEEEEHRAIHARLKDVEYYVLYEAPLTGLLGLC